MNNIGDLLMHYGFKNIARRVKMPNPSIARARFLSEHQLTSHNAVKVELGKGYSNEPIHTKVYKPSPPVPNRHEKTTETDSNVPREKTHIAARAKKPSEGIKQPNFDGFEELSFQQFKESWASREGDENYNSRYDYDGNGVIDVSDYIAFGKELQGSLEEFKQAWGSRVGDDNYNSTYDFDDNGVIDVSDWIEYGKKWVT